MDDTDEDTYKHPVIDILLVIGGFFSFSFVVLALVIAGIATFVWLSMDGNLHFLKAIPQ